MESILVDWFSFSLPGTNLARILRIEQVQLTLYEVVRKISPECVPPEADYAQALYLDFTNLFLLLLRITGLGRN